MLARDPIFGQGLILGQDDEGIPGIQKMIIDWHSWVQIAVVVAVGLACVGWLMAHLFLHVKPSRVDTFEELTAQIGQGQPTLLYFYSNF